MGGLFNLECSMPFRTVLWRDLKPGDLIYYFVPRGRSELRPGDRAHGPFVVVDPSKAKLRNMNGIELCLSKVIPLVLDESAYLPRDDGGGPGAREVLQQ